MVQDNAMRAAITIQKMAADDNSQVYLNTFEWSAKAARWPKDQWAMCLVGEAQQTIDIIPAEDVAHYTKVREAILQTLNLSSEVY